MLVFTSPLPHFTMAPGVSLVTLGVRTQPTEASRSRGTTAHPGHSTTHSLRRPVGVLERFSRGHGGGGGRDGSCSWGWGWARAGPVPDPFTVYMSLCKAVVALGRLFTGNCLVSLPGPRQQLQNDVSTLRSVNNYMKLGTSAYDSGIAAVQPS